MWYWYKAKLSWRFVIVPLLVLSVAVVIGYAQQNTFVYETISEQETLDPVWVFDTASGVPITQIYEPLTYFKGGSTSEQVPIVAASLPVIATTGLPAGVAATYTYEIRSGITFHDGSSLTAADVQYTFLRHLITDRADGATGIVFTPALLGAGSTRSDNGLNTNFIDNICGYNGKTQAVTVSGNKVIFNLAQAFAPFVQVIASAEAGIVSKNFVVANGGWPGCVGNDRNKDIDNFKKYNDPDDPSKTELFDKENGSGPYKLQQWDKTAKITTLACYANYWQKDSSGNGPCQKAFQTIILKNIEDDGPRLLDLKNGAADVIDIGGPVNLPELYKTNNTRYVVKLPSLVVQSLFFNFNIQQPGGSNPLIGSGQFDGNGIRPDFFQDIHVRKAFNYLFDHALQISRAEGGLAKTVATPNIQGLAYHNPAQKGVSDTAGIDVTKTFADQPLSGGNPLPLQLAANELKQAFGGTVAAPGPVWQNGFVFTIRYNSGNLRRQSATNILRSNLALLDDRTKFGRHGTFNLVVQQVPFPQILKQISDGSLSMYALGWAPDYIDPADYIPQWVGSNAVTATFSGPGGIDKLTGNKAKKSFGSSNGAFRVTAKGVGPAGNLISLEVKAAGNNTALSVAVSGTAITVNSATNATGQATSTAAQIRDAINAKAEAAVLVSADLPSGSDGSAVTGAQAKANLEGGTGEGWGTPGTTPGGFAYNNWDELIIAAVTKTDAAVRQDLYFTLQKLYVDNAIALVIGNPEAEFAERSSLNGFRYNLADPGNVFPVLYNPAAGINFSKAASGNGNDDVATICASYPTAVFVTGGDNSSPATTKKAVNCQGNPFSPIPGDR
ncbi:hypothetical protein HYR54_04330 [Candidatus Acetothermia bacterium]|nr:hypothetical protein [Candidatus Acetothermia bacterium]